MTRTFNVEKGKKQSDKQSGKIEKSCSVKHDGNLSCSKKSSSNVENPESGKLGRKILISSEVSNTVEKIIWNKVSLQISLERNPTSSSYIFILSVNFENLTVRLHVLITSKMLTKFQENQRSIAMSSNKCYNFKFL